MASAPLPPDEQERLKALESYHLVNSSTEEVLDSITQIVAQLCDTPVALITLVDQDKQWFKSAVGLPDTAPVARNLSFCAHAILDNEIMEIADTAKDERFSDNPYVTGSPNVRFYAGAPLINPDNYKLGALCIVDRKPRHLTKDQKNILKKFSSIIVAIFEARKKIHIEFTRRQALEVALSQANNELQKTPNTFSLQTEVMNNLTELGNEFLRCEVVAEWYELMAEYAQRLFPKSYGAVYSIKRMKREANWGDISLLDNKFLEKNFLNVSEMKVIKSDDTLNHLVWLPFAANGSVFAAVLLEFSSLSTQNLDDVQQMLLKEFLAKGNLGLENILLRQSLHQYSVSDPLTRLFNRRYLEMALDDQIDHVDSNDRNLAVLFIDIDNFKKINEQHGHEMGDEVLKGVADCIKENVRDSDIACRVGGEEFILIMPGVPQDVAAQRAEFLRKLVAEKSFNKTYKLIDQVTISVGVSMYSKETHTADQMLQAANAALSKAKEAGRNCVFVAE